MHDSTLNSDPADPSEPTYVHDEAPPAFGLVDVIEAFTAMRHEWRGQTKEGRAAIETIESAVAKIGQLEEKLLALADDNIQKEPRALVELIADVDHQLTRSILGVENTEAGRRRREEADLDTISRYFNEMSAPARWFARPLFDFVLQLLGRRGPEIENSAAEGLNLVLARLRRSMKEHRIERIETVGQPFDAETMNAIDTVESADHPPDFVAEQLTPGYRWQGRILRFADVRVAAAVPASDSPPNNG